MGSAGSNSQYDRGPLPICVRLTALCGYATAASMGPGGASSAGIVGGAAIAGSADARQRNREDDGRPEQSLHGGALSRTTRHVAAGALPGGAGEGSRGHSARAFAGVKPNLRGMCPACTIRGIVKVVASPDPMTRPLRSPLKCWAQGLLVPDVPLMPERWTMRLAKALSLILAIMGGLALAALGVRAEAPDPPSPSPTVPAIDPPPAPDSREARLEERLRKMEEMNRTILDRLEAVTKTNEELSKRLDSRASRDEAEASRARRGRSRSRSGDRRPGGHRPERQRPGGRGDRDAPRRASRAPAPRPTSSRRRRS